MQIAKEKIHNVFTFGVIKINNKFEMKIRLRGGIRRWQYTFVETYNF